MWGDLASLCQASGRTPRHFGVARTTAPMSRADDEAAAGPFERPSTDPLGTGRRPVKRPTVALCSHWRLTIGNDALYTACAQPCTSILDLDGAHGRQAGLSCASADVRCPWILWRPALPRVALEFDKRGTASREGPAMASALARTVRTIV
jgi:hypothetical protein